MEKLTITTQQRLTGTEHLKKGMRHLLEYAIPVTQTKVERFHNRQIPALDLYVAKLEEERDEFLDAINGGYPFDEVVKEFYDLVLSSVNMGTAYAMNNHVPTFVWQDKVEGMAPALANKLYDRLEDDKLRPGWI